MSLMMTSISVATVMETGVLSNASSFSLCVTMVSMYLKSIRVLAAEKGLMKGVGLGINQSCIGEKERMS